jgi:hypothetical protein
MYGVAAFFFIRYPLVRDPFACRWANAPRRGYRSTRNSSGASMADVSRTVYRADVVRIERSLSAISAPCFQGRMFGLEAPDLSLQLDMVERCSFLISLGASAHFPAREFRHRASAGHPAKEAVDGAQPFA